VVSFIKIEGRIVKGNFLERPNRFLALVKVEGNILPSFLPDPGRMWELLTPGTEVILRKASDGNRKTDYDLIAVFHNSQIVSVDSRVPNKLVFEALKNKDIEELSAYDLAKSEFSYGHTRFDFLLTNEHARCLLEVKSCTLVKNGVAMFPDAPTERGRRQVRGLMKAKKEGFRACVLFIIQRTDAQVFAPNDETDPEFGKVLRDAALEGVEIHAYYSELIKTNIILRGKVKVEL